MEVPNITHIAPEDLLEKNRALLEKYKDIAKEKFSHLPTVATSHPTTVTTPPASITLPTPIPTVQETQKEYDTVTPATSNESVSLTTTAGEGSAPGSLFSALLVLALGGGGILLHLALLSRDMHGTAGIPLRWYPLRQVFTGAHGLMAAIFFLQIIAFAGSLLSGNTPSMSGSPLIFPGGFLLLYGAVSSAGMAYASFSGRVMRLASSAHILLAACGFLLFAIPGLLPDIPFSPLPPALIFLASSCVVLIQVCSPRNAPARPAAGFADTLLYEEKPADFATPFPPELAQRYTGARFLHKGGVARVFSARRLEDGVVVAVKVPIRSDEQTGRSLLREMSVWKALSHPGIVQVYAVNILPVPYVEMEYLPSSLADLPTPVDPCRASGLIKKIALAVAFAHGQGVIHRDLKPGNILLTADGEPKVGDWGLSRNDSIPSETTLHGFSLSYAAPEQLDPGRFGQTTQQTDIYQLGIILYTLLTGMLPFPGESIAEVTRERLDGTVSAPSSLVPSAGAFDTVIGSCLAVDPSDRYRTAADLVADIDRIREKICGSSGGSEDPGKGGIDDRQSA